VRFETKNGERSEKKEFLELDDEMKQWMHFDVEQFIFPLHHPELEEGFFVCVRQQVQTCC
jgi:hypothetical protein